MSCRLRPSPGPDAMQGAEHVSFTKVIATTGESLVNTTAAYSQINPRAAFLTDGRLVIVWMDSSPSGTGFSSFVLRGQLYDTAGNKSGTEFAINVGSWNHQSPSVTALANGGFVAVWMDMHSSPAAVFQIFDSAMNPVGAVTPLQNPLQAFGVGQFPDVTALANGNFVVTWTDIDGHDQSGGAYQGIFEQTFSSAGAAIDAAHLVPVAIAGNQLLPSVAGLVSGGHVIVWEDAPSASANDLSGPYDIRGRIFGNDGGPATGDFTVNTTLGGDQSRPEVARLAGGGFVVVWNDLSASGGDTSGSAVRGQLFNAAGDKVGGEFLVNTTTAGSQYAAHFAGLPFGGFVVA